MNYTLAQIASLIDHSLLQPTLTDEELEQGCMLARQHGVASVCIKPYYLQRCAEILAGSAVKASTTIGFPHGGHTTAIKVAEAIAALDDGGQELDMVVNVGKVLSGDWTYVLADIRAVLEATHARGQILKVIFENAYLQDPHKVRLCQICSELGADFVKTSTGYASNGATIEDLKLMRKHCAPQVQVKAAGGVRDLDTILAMRTIGVTRVGCSRTADILAECRKRLGGAGA